MNRLTSLNWGLIAGIVVTASPIIAILAFATATLGWGVLIVIGIAVAIVGAIFWGTYLISKNL